MGRRIAVVGKACVSCGTCVKVCPKQALTIYKGIRAVVNAEKCVGCGICMVACPAGIINLEENLKGKGVSV